MASQMFLGADRPGYAKDRYECTEKHNDTDNFIACIEKRSKAPMECCLSKRGRTTLKRY